MYVEKAAETDIRKKPACILLMKLTPDFSDHLEVSAVNFNNILQAAFKPSLEP